jgi:hypothetical protein
VALKVAGVRFGSFIVPWLTAERHIEKLVKMEE